jgi:hypothetical protein
MTRPTVSVLRTALEKCYQRAPRECEGGGSVRCCADCHNLLVETTTGSTCVDDRCPRSGPVKVGRSLPVSEGAGWVA